MCYDRFASAIFAHMCDWTHDNIRTCGDIRTYHFLHGDPLNPNEVDKQILGVRDTYGWSCL